MEKEILFTYAKNLNNRYYTLESLKKIIDDHKREVERLGHCFGVFRKETDFFEYGERGLINIKDVAFTVESLRINRKGILVGNIKLIDTPAGKKLKKELKNIVFRTSVWGNVKSDGEVDVENLISINAMTTEQDPFSNVIGAQFRDI
jgi:hypothetical protein